MNIEFSFIIPNYNGAEKLKKCVNLLLKQNFKKFEIIIVDNNSLTDKKILSNFKKNTQIKVYSFEKNYGYTKAVNFGALKARGKFLIIINNDAYVKDNYFLNKIKSKIYNVDFSKIVGIFPEVIFENNHNFINGGYAIWHEKFMWIEPHIGLCLWSEKRIKKTKEVFGALFVCLIIPKRKFIEIGLLDEIFFTYGEDFDFCYRANLLGFKFLYFPKIKIFHDYRSSSREKYDPYYSLFFFLRNYLFVVFKNYELNNLVTKFKYYSRFILYYFKTSIKNIDFTLFFTVLKVILSFLIKLPLIMLKRIKIQKIRKISDKEIFNTEFILNHNPYYINNIPVLSYDSIFK